MMRVLIAQFQRSNRVAFSCHWHTTTIHLHPHKAPIQDLNVKIERLTFQSIQYLQTHHVKKAQQNTAVLSGEILVQYISGYRLP